MKREREELPDYLQKILVERGLIPGLENVFVKNMPLDKAIENVFKSNIKWKSSARGFVSINLNSIIRNWRLLNTIAGLKGEMNTPFFKKIIYTHFILKGEKPTFLNENDLPATERKLLEKNEKYRKVRKIRESYPDWLDEEGEKQLGKKWDEVAHALNKKGTVYLRANTLKTDRANLISALEAEHFQVKSVVSCQDAIIISSTARIFRTDAFQKGLFEIQDLSSQEVSRFLNPIPGSRVIDACAGAGGKSLHLASLLNNKGKILALDIQKYRLDELRKRATRAGVNIIETRHIDSSKVIKRLQDTADYLLLDLPCSGTGVLKKNPDAKWRLTREQLRILEGTQEELFNSYSKMLKPGGTLVYATCSIFPSEGEDQVKKFLIGHPEWELENEKRFWPDEIDSDGFYMARLNRPV